MSVKLLVTLAILVTAMGCGKLPEFEMPEKDKKPKVDAPVSPASVASDETPADETPVDDEDPMPLPPATVYTFNFFNSTGICEALINWTPETQTIVFPVNSAPPTDSAAFNYSFEASGVYIQRPDGSQRGLVANFNDTVTITKAGALNHPPVCVITVTNGQLASID